MRKYKPNTKYNPNEVDTGFIYGELRYQYKNYPDKFFTIFKGNLMGLLLKKKVVTIPYNDETMQFALELEKHWSINISNNDTAMI